jgi:hypothetical protein
MPAGLIFLMLAGCGCNPCTNGQAAGSALAISCDPSIPAIGYPVSSDTMDPCGGDAIAEDDREENQTSQLRHEAPVGLIPRADYAPGRDPLAPSYCRRDIASSTLLYTSCVLLI